MDHFSIKIDMNKYLFENCKISALKEEIYFKYDIFYSKSFAYYTTNHEVKFFLINFNVKSVKYLCVG